MHRSVLFPELLRFRVDRGLVEAVGRAALKSRTTPSEYLRRAVVAQLAADGVPPAPLTRDPDDDDPGPFRPAPAQRLAA